MCPLGRYMVAERIFEEGRYLKLVPWRGGAGRMVAAGDVQEAVIVGHGCGDDRTYDVTYPRDGRPPRREIRVREDLLRRKEPRQVVQSIVAQDHVQMSPHDAHDMFVGNRVPDVHLNGRNRASLVGVG